MSLSVIIYRHTLLLEVPASITILSPTFIPRVSSVISMGLIDDGLNMVLLLPGLWTMGDWDTIGLVDLRDLEPVCEVCRGVVDTRDLGVDSDFSP